MTQLNEKAHELSKLLAAECGTTQDVTTLLKSLFTGTLEQKSMRGKVGHLREDLKSVNRRIETLDEHLRHSDNFKKYRKIKKRYEDLYSEHRAAKKETGFFAERKAQKALDAVNEYHEAHRSELFKFDKAEEYLRGVLKDRFDLNKQPPITKWQAERDAKIAERDSLNLEYQALKDETAKVEKIRRSVTEIMQSETQERTPTRAKGMEL